MLVLDELPEKLSQIDHEDDGNNVKFYSVVERILSSVYPPEIPIFEAYVKDKLGNMTFEESYLLTDRILNITITPSNEKSMPRLLNYLTAPNVLICSAVDASIGTGVLHSKVELLVKDHKGRIRPYPTASGAPVHFNPSNSTIYIKERESPYTKLTELFNVNNFIISLARPYLAPLVLADLDQRGHQGIKVKVLKLIQLETIYRLRQLAKFGLLPGRIQHAFVDETIPGGFQITIVPTLPSLIRDLGKTFDSNNINEKVEYWVMVGERSVWPQLAIVWSRCAIEFVLDDIYNSIQTKKSMR